MKQGVFEGKPCFCFSYPNWWFLLNPDFAQWNFSLLVSALPFVTSRTYLKTVSLDQVPADLCEAAGVQAYM